MILAWACPFNLLFFYFVMRRLCVVYVWLRQTSVNKNTTNLERVLYLCLVLDWRWSDVAYFWRLNSHVEETLTFLSMQKMCTALGWRTQ